MIGRICEIVENFEDVEDVRMRSVVVEKKKRMKRWNILMQPGLAAF